MVVEAAPVVPREEDRGRVPVGAVHHRVHEARDVRLAGADRPGRVLAVVLGGHDPRHRRERPVLRGGVEVRDRLDVAELAVLLDGVEARQRVPDAGRGGALRRRDAAQRLVVLAVGLPTGREVVAPAHVVLVQQVGEVGPREDARRLLALVERVRARRRVVVHRAPRRPLRHEEQVLGQAPRRVRLEHAVLEHEVARVLPVVRDVGCGVVAHHVDRAVRAARVRGVGAVASARPRRR